MTKLTAILGVLFVSGSLGAVPVEGDIRPEPLSAPALSGGEVHAIADVDQVEVAEARSDSTAPVPIGEMSDEEKERRREVCRKAHDQCYDQCTSYYANKNSRDKLKPCYKRCADDIADCMKAIPN